MSTLKIEYMTATATFPLTNSDLAEMAGPSGQVRFPASFDEFWGVLGDAEFNVEYFDHEIIATMSYETDFHSAIATQVSYLLKSIFGGNKSFRVFNGNRPVCIPECEHAVFNPDGSVVALPSKVFEYRPGMTAELTPALIFEVLSKSTRSYDLADKLPCYKRIPSLQQIIFVDGGRVEVSVWERSGADARWLETRLDLPDDTFSVLGQPIRLSNIYEDTLLAS